jgi:hypothetical protein
VSNTSKRLTFQRFNGAPGLLRAPEPLPGGGVALTAILPAEVLRELMEAARQTARIRTEGVTIRDNLAMTPMRVSWTVATGPPATAGDQAGLIALSILCWLVFLAGPVLISKLPAGDQAATSDYINALPGIAVALTGYVLTTRKRK